MEKTTNEEIGQAINAAAGELPEGYALNFMIERFGYGIELDGPDGELIPVNVESDNIPDEINELVVAAIKHSGASAANLVSLG